MPYEALNKTLYTTAATNEGGRDGTVRSDDGVIELELGRPGSRSNPKANPETLFAAGYAACFGGALGHVAGESGIDVSGSTVRAAVSFGFTDSGVGIAVAIEAFLPGVDEALAKDLVERAHLGCPYSKATHGNIDVTVTSRVA